MGIYGAVEGNGGVTGAMGGASSGFELGSSVLPGIGGAIGAVIGGVVGYMGLGARAKAHDWWNRQGQPHMEATDQAFNTGSMDYLTAYNDINNLDGEAFHVLSAMGPEGGLSVTTRLLPH